MLECPELEDLVDIAQGHHVRVTWLGVIAVAATEDHLHFLIGFPRLVNGNGWHALASI